MNYIAIDTSDKHLTIIVKKDGKFYEFFTEDSGKKHSVMLMPELEKFLIEAEMSVKDADFYACVTGAGSFTGIRIGISTIKAFMLSSDKPCLAVTSFDTLAYNKQGKVLAVIDANHDAYYVAGYDSGKVILPPSFMQKAEVEKVVPEYESIVSSTVTPFGGEIVSRSDGLKKAIESKETELSSDPESLVPVYVRKSQAEEGR